MSLKRIQAQQAENLRLRQQLDTARTKLEKIASFTQTTKLLWWQIEAREALAAIGEAQPASELHPSHEADFAADVALDKNRNQSPISQMVDRFLGWKLPHGFCPDCYINFDREKAVANNGWPIGTNLLTADQARAMFEYCIEWSEFPQSAIPDALSPGKFDLSGDNDFNRGWNACREAMLAAAPTQPDSEQPKIGCVGHDGECCKDRGQVEKDAKRAVASALIDADHLSECSERLLAALNRKAGGMDRVEIADMGDVGAPERARIELEQAEESVSEYWRAVRSATYEYRKRAERARAAMEKVGSGGTADVPETGFGDMAQTADPSGSPHADGAEVKS